MDVAVNFKGGGSIVKLKPVFSSNGENVFVSSKNTVFQYNTKTGKLVYKYKGWDSDIIGISYSTIDNQECIAACSKSGKIIVWTVTKKLKLTEAQIQKEHVKHFSVLSWNLTEGLDVLVAYNSKYKKVAFAKINTKQTEKQKVVLKIPKKKYALDVCTNKYFCVVSENVGQCVDLQTFASSRFQMAENNRKFTCVTCHPEEQMVLTGDNTGRVVLWQSIFEKKTQAVFHWHTLPVKCIAFSTLGSHFYSGADEAVLVKWQIDNPNQKKFLPRLAAGVVQLSVSDNNAFVAVATSDNAVRIVDSQMNQICLIQHLVLGNQFESGIVYDPITRALVMNGNIGCVQFYSPTDMSLLYNVDIVSQNKITDERDCKLENTDVRKLALSRSGKWLATVEERRIGKKCKEIRLKFWYFNSEKQTYELNTSIEFPHESSINSIAIQPSSTEDNLKCITVGNDRIFKVWQVAEIVSVYRNGPIWKCISVGKFREMPCKGLSFSMDGSLFGIAFDAILTIWASENCELKSTLLHSKFKEKIRFIQFGQGNQCHLVATASKSQLSVWNILTLTMSWVVSLSNVNVLVADPLSTFMLVICGDDKLHPSLSNKVFVFEPASPNLLFSSKELLGNAENIVAATFVPSIHSNDTRLQWHERSHLYFITSKQELYCISKKEDSYEYSDEYGEDMSEEMSVFTKLKPQVERSEVKRSVTQHMFPKDMGYHSYRQLLEAPIETLEPISKLAMSLLESLVLQREKYSSSKNETT